MSAHSKELYTFRIQISLLAENNTLSKDAAVINPPMYGTIRVPAEITQFPDSIKLECQAMLDSMGDYLHARGKTDPALPERYDDLLDGMVVAIEQESERRSNE